MTADDLTRRAIIAAHDADCGCGPSDVDAHSSPPPLTTREQAIVALWRADRDDYQGRYETAHESFLASERDRDVAEAGRHDEKEIANAALAAAAKEQQRAETAEAAIERARAVHREHTANTGPVERCVCIGCEMARALDRTEATS